MLSRVELDYPFQRVIEKHVSSGFFECESILDAGTMERRAYKTGYVSSLATWNRLDSSYCIIVVKNNTCNESNMLLLDLTRFVNLRELIVGDESLMYVNEVKLIGLSELESVEIGMNSFTQHKNGHGYDPNRHFYLKNCPKLKSLKVGRYSFSDYSVIEIENCGLEMIEMGDLNEWSDSFYWASFELKSILSHNE